MPRLIAFLGLFMAALAGGCPPEDFNRALPITQQQIDEITSNTSLDPYEQRQQLEALGVPPSTVNALFADQRTANQFGGDLRTAYNKVIAPALMILTPDEIQIYGDLASSVSTDVDAELTDSEALAVTNFFQANGFNSSAALENYLDRGGEVPDTIPDGVLEALFVDFDPALLLPELP